MKLFNLDNGLYCVQSSVCLTTFGHTLLLSVSAQPDNVGKSRNKTLLGRPTLCIKISSDPITFLLRCLFFTFAWKITLRSF